MTKNEFFQKAALAHIGSAISGGHGWAIRRAKEISEALEKELGEDCWDDSTVAENLDAIYACLNTYVRQIAEEVAGGRR